MSENASKATPIPAWMATFADLMCLLMCFFVLLFAFSKLEEERFTSLAEAFMEAFGGVQMIKSNSTDLTKGMEAGIVTRTGNLAVPLNEKQQQQLVQQIQQSEVEDLLKELQEAMKEEIVNQSIVIERENDDVIIRFPEHVSFASGSAKLVPQAGPLIQRVVGHLKNSHSIIVAGHTDNRPVGGGRFSSNWELSAARAAAVAESVLKTGAVQPDRLTVAGYAFTRPIEDNATRSGRAKNRRVEIVVKTRPAEPASDPGQVIPAQ